jgi:hypothetical protein
MFPATVSNQITETCYNNMKLQNHRGIRRVLRVNGVYTYYTYHLITVR